jgi:hypothetical protein
MPRKSLYDKGNQLLKEARNETDPQIKRIMIQSAHRYLLRDATIPKVNEAVPVVAIYAIAVGSLIVSWIYLGAWAALGISICVFCFLTVALGAYLRICGKVTEKGLLVIIRESFKVVLGLGRKGGKVGQTDNKGKNVRR